MKRMNKMGKLVVLVTVLAFAIATVPGFMSTVSAETSADMKVTVKVSEKGFFDERGRLLGPRNPLQVPMGKKVTITFVFDEALSSLAIGDVHQMAITADDGWNIEGEKIWVLNREASLTFTAGENGRKQYRGYCILDCLGMDHLSNLVIKVV